MLGKPDVVAEGNHRYYAYGIVIRYTPGRIVEEMDVANREEIVKRIRALTGMRDPDQPEPTPEQHAMEAKKAAAEDRQVRMQEAEIADKEASAKQKEAAASTAAATARNVLASMAGTNVATQRAALEAALMMISTPAVVPVADVVARESGFVSRGEDEDNAAVDALLPSSPATP